MSDAPAFSEPAYREPAVVPRAAVASQVLAEETSSSSPDINDASLPAIRLKPLEDDGGFRSAGEDGEPVEEEDARHEPGPPVALLGPLAQCLSRLLTPLAGAVDALSSRHRREASSPRLRGAAASRDEPEGPGFVEKLKEAWSGLMERLGELFGGLTTRFSGLTARFRRSESEPEPEADEEDDADDEPESETVVP